MTDSSQPVIRTTDANAVASKKSIGQLAYEQELAVKPNYHSGEPRKIWAALHEADQQSWEQNPVPRYTSDGELRQHLMDSGRTYYYPENGRG